MHFHRLNLLFTLPLFLLGTSLAAGVVYELPLAGNEYRIGNLLTWSTAVEEHNALFAVERSVDGGRTFLQIGRVDGRGDTDTEVPYSFMDLGVPHVRSVYRLRQVDEDGTAAYSHSVVVQKRWTNNFALVQLNTTEVTETLRFSIDARVTGELAYSLVTDTGILVEKRSVEVRPGLNDFELPMAGLPAARYTLDLRLGDEHEQLTVEKVLTEQDRRPARASLPGGPDRG